MKDKQTDIFNTFRGSAEISDCGHYRYSLYREWRYNPRLIVWMMLNPSTADALTNDPTLRRCIDFSRQWGYGGLIVVNLYAFRASKPKTCGRRESRLIRSGN